MSHLKILVCTLLVAISVTSAASVKADHQYPGSQNAGCGRLGGYPSMSGAYGTTRPAYAPRQNYGNCPSPRNMGYDIPRQFDDGYTLQGYGITPGFRNQYTAPQNYGYEHRVLRGRDSFSYGAMNSNRNTGSVYDSVHGDYHTIPARGNAQQSLDPYRSGWQNSHNGDGVSMNLGW